MKRWRRGLRGRIGRREVVGREVVGNVRGKRGGGRISGYGRGVGVK